MAEVVANLLVNGKIFHTFEWGSTWFLPRLKRFETRVPPLFPHLFFGGESAYTVNFDGTKGKHAERFAAKHGGEI